MLIGVMSDSHDNLPNIKAAVDLFNQRGVEFVLHAGDFIAPFALRPMLELSCPWIGVFGNNDGEQTGLTKISQGRIQPAPYELNLDGKKVVLVHDLEQYDLRQFIDRGAWLVVSGHTHEKAMSKREDVLFLNPGEAGGWLNGKSTIAILNTKTSEVEFNDL